MAHYAFLEGNVVVEVIVGSDETEGVPAEAWERHYGDIRGLRCLQCSYNTRGGVNARGGPALRGNYPGIGFTYDETLDAFIPPRPDGDGWLIDRETYQWVRAVN